MLRLTLLVAIAAELLLSLILTANTVLPGADHFRSGIYLRLLSFTTPTPANPEMVWLRGVADPGIRRNHFFHNHWKLEFSLCNFLYIVSRIMPLPSRRNVIVSSEGKFVG